jgi:hypothetical protein
MLAVVGSPSFAPGSTPGAAGDAGGLAAGIARADAADGVEVQLVGKVGDDPFGDAVLLALGRERVGHLALLRDAGQATPIAPARVAVADLADTEAIATLLGDDATAEEPPDGPGAALPPVGLAMEPADISLGLRYVREFRVLVAADPLDGPSSLVIADAATFADAALIVVAPHGMATPVTPASAVVLEAPETDPDGAFATLVGRLAAALDRGMNVGEAFRSATEQGGWERAAG